MPNKISMVKKMLGIAAQPTGKTSRSLSHSCGGRSRQISEVNSVVKKSRAGSLLCRDDGVRLNELKVSAKILQITNRNRRDFW
jgi:hypothetical protein